MGHKGHDKGHGKPKKQHAPNVFLNAMEVMRIRAFCSTLTAMGVRGWPQKLSDKVDAIRFAPDSNPEQQ